MKKILFFAAIAAAAMTSCSQNDLKNQQQTKSITFDNAYIGKAAKGAPVTGISFADGATIGVYGMNTTASINMMENQEITRNAGVWTYSPVQFYAKDVIYSFTAYAPYNKNLSIATGTLPSYSVSTEIASQVDLMYTQEAATTTWDGKAESTPKEVQFVFKHALSQVKFSAKTVGDYSALYTVKVTGVTIEGVNSVGTLTLASGAWDAWGTPAAYTQSVNNVVITNKVAQLANADGNVLMLIPQAWTADLNVKINLDVTAIVEGGGNPEKAGVKVVTATIPASKWMRNAIYNYQMSLDLSTILDMKPIVFGDPTIESWTSESTVDINGGAESI
ncbi:MAG: fimbrillin family protein [Mucinivorans sp.]